ncbi:unnamed protein product [Musa acuminata subsp. burmannicoides]
MPKKSYMNSAVHSSVKLVLSWMCKLCSSETSATEMADIVEKSILS